MAMTDGAFQQVNSVNMDVDSPSTDDRILTAASELSNNLAKTYDEIAITNGEFSAAQAEFDRLSEGFDSSKAILSALGQKNGGREAFTCISQIEQNGQHFAMGNQNLEEFHLKLAELVTKSGDLKSANSALQREYMSLKYELDAIENDN